MLPMSAAAVARTRLVGAFATGRPALTHAVRTKATARSSLTSISTSATTPTTDGLHQPRFGSTNYRCVRTRLFSSASTDFRKVPLASLDLAQSFGKDYYLRTPEEDVIPLQDGQRLVCVGDVHGDYSALTEFLKIAGVLNDEGDWCGGNTILVQTGDVLDRGSEELQCYALLSKLSQQSVLDDGMVICLWGNHEVLNSMGMFHYATDDSEYEDELGVLLDKALPEDNWRAQFAANQPSRWAVYEPGGILAEPLMQHLKVAVCVGDTLCVHAGLTKEQLDDSGGLTEMNRAAQEWIRQGEFCASSRIAMDWTVK